MRWTWWHTLLLLGVGLSITALTLAIGFRNGFWLLFLPLVLPPIFFGSRGREAPVERRCPTCAWATVDARDRFCPRDGTPFR